MTDIVATAFTMLLSTLFSFKSIDSTPIPDMKGWIIFAVIAATAVNLTATESCLSILTVRGIM